VGVSYGECMFKFLWSNVKRNKNNKIIINKRLI